jgi:thiamine biosynthesis lipoprotein
VFLTALMLSVVLAGGCEDEPEASETPPQERGGSEPGSGPSKSEPGHPAASDATPGPGEPTGPRASAPVFTRSRAMMGTIFRISVAGASPERAAPAVRDALSEIARLETVLSEWLPGSEISAINEAAGQHPVEVSKDTLAVVKAGVDVSRWSRGAFDLSWAALRGLYDFRPEHRDIPSRREIRRRLSSINWKDIEVDAAESTVFLTKPRMAIGTGGIAKGYALDRAADILRSAGLENYMLFGGGQVQVAGQRGDRPWRVGIQHPRKQQAYFAFFESTGGSISTSGDYEHAFFDDEGKRWHHILDPRKGLPADASMSVTLLAPSGLYADALSTAAFILGPKKAQAMFDRIPYDAEMVMVDERCKLIVTPGTRDRLVFRMQLRDDGRLPDCSGS